MYCFATCLLRSLPTFGHCLQLGLGVVIAFGTTTTIQAQSRGSLVESVSTWVAPTAEQLELAADQSQSDQRMLGYYKHEAMKSQSSFADLPWQFLGPTNISGRVTDLAIPTPRGANYTMYAATASGGVWKTINEGTTWEPIFEHGPSTSIGDITIAPSDQETVWIGLGEANIFRSSMAGAGVYKSTDGGTTWQHKGLTDTHTIPRIVIHPTDPNIVYVAASGHEWTTNPERGVYKTSDGGDTWEQVLSIDEMTGAIDLMMDPEDPETLYASTWERIRERWNDPRTLPSYDGSGIHKSTDGGQSWQPINDGLPAPQHRGRIGIDVCQTSPNTLYAFVDNYDLADEQPGEDELDSYGRPKEKLIKGAEVYRSDDKGESWTKVSESNEYMSRLSSTYGWVFGQIRVDPSDADTIYVMGLSLNVSNDGGKTFRRLGGMHSDHHALWIDPANPRYLVNGNDGGVVVSYDAGESWRQFTNEIPVVQFYNIGYDMESPFHVYGSIQDHGSFRAAVDWSNGRDRIRPTEWERAPGGEGSSHAIDPTNGDVVYSAGFYGRLTRSDLGTGERVGLLPEPIEGEAPIRGQWIAPFIISPHNPRIIYHGMNYLYRSMDRGERIERISPDLTFNDPNKIGDISYQTIYTISESPLQFGLIYVGTDDGRVHVTRDSGTAWQAIESGLASDRCISRIEASRYELGTVYMTQNGKRNDDFTPYVWKSTDFGRTWTSLVANIPSGPVNVIREDPKNRNVLYVGTDLGVYVSVDGGENWQVLANNLPTTYVHDLQVHPRDDLLIIATHGRGMYVMDARPIQSAE